MFHIPCSDPARRRFFLQSGALALCACSKKSPEPVAVQPSRPWPQGGSSGLSPEDRLFDPFGAVPTECALVAQMTKGPCTTPKPPHRADISEGWKGLPLVLTLRLLDANCQPIQRAALRVWHTNHQGSYSGQTPRNDFCLFQAKYAAMNFFRGEQSTNERGIVRFYSCYPGWYPGRAIHIHFQLLHQGKEHAVSQLYFPEALTRRVFAEHPVYRPHGQPDTDQRRDSIFNTASPQQQQALTLDLLPSPSGALRAYKTVQVMR